MGASLTLLDPLFHTDPMDPRNPSDPRTPWFCWLQPSTFGSGINTHSGNKHGIVTGRRFRFYLGQTFERLKAPWYQLIPMAPSVSGSPGSFSPQPSTFGSGAKTHSGNKHGIVPERRFCFYLGQTFEKLNAPLGTNGSPWSPWPP